MNTTETHTVESTDNRSAVCVIPARGGSKRIPGKNKKRFCGKPMIARAIETALDSACFSDVVVSTDCAEIADAAVKAGADVPFMRPAALADDYTITSDVVAHAIRTLQASEAYTVSLQTPVCCLYATSPFALADDIRRSGALLSACEFVIPVTSFAFPIQRAAKRDQDGRLSLFHPEHYTTRSQDLEEAWHDVGQFYWSTAEGWLSGQSPYDMHTQAYTLPRWRVQDIDTPEDWQRAELMFELLQAHDKQDAELRPAA